MALINKLTDIAEAIREKTGKTDLLTLEQMPIEIAAIEAGGGSGEAKPIVINDSLYYMGSGNNTYSVDYQGTEGNMLILFVMHRGELTQKPAGWTELGTITESGDSAAGFTTIIQYITVFYKNATNDVETITVMQALTSTCIIGLAELRNAGTPIFEETTRKENVSCSGFNPNSKPSNGLCIWFATSVYWNSSYPNWVTTADAIRIHSSSTAPRLGVFLDFGYKQNSLFSVHPSGIDDKYYSIGAISVPMK